MEVAEFGNSVVPSEPLLLSDFVVHHTWSIRTLSHFVVPLDLDNGISILEDGISKFLRAQWISKHAEEYPDDSKYVHSMEDQGTFVTIFWGHYNETGETRETKISLKRKRPSDSVSDEETTANQITDKKQRHLIIDAKVQDEPSAQVVLCFPKFSQSKENESQQAGAENVVERFEFCLFRGRALSYESIFGWLETFTGCVVAKLPFSPNAAELSQAATVWTTEYWLEISKGQQSKVERNENSENKQDAPDAIGKPLTLTFAVPPNLATSGLDSISINVPPCALLNLCSDMVLLRKQQNHTDQFNKDDEAPLPILRALQLYIQETFRINTKPFSLVRASCSVATFGCDGRFKLRSELFAGRVLEELQAMIQQRIETRTGENTPEDEDLQQGAS